MENFKLNDRVIVIGKNTKGKIAFIGETQFADGVMFGVILDEPKGKYSGTINDVCYFNCKKNHGTFVRACQLQKDFNYPLDDWGRRRYPNYLKETSSKHGVKSQEKPLNSEDGKKETKVKAPDSAKIDVSEDCGRPAYPDYFKENSSNHGLNTQEKFPKSENSQEKTKVKTSDSLNMEVLEDCGIPAYPNYLKENSSKHLMKSQEKPLKPKNSKKKVKVKTSDSPKIDVSEDCGKPEYPNDLRENSSKHGLNTQENSPKSENNQERTKVETPDLPNIDVLEDCGRPAYLNYKKEKNSGQGPKEPPKSENGKKKKVKTPDSPNFDFSEDCGRPAYPKYLKENSSEHGPNTHKKLPKSENSQNKIKLKTPNTPNIDVTRSEKTLDETFQKGDPIMDQISQPICFDESEKHLKNLKDVLEELAVMKQKASEDKKKMEAVHCYLRMLKTYLKWNDEYEKSTVTGDDRTRNLLQLLINNVMNKIQDLVDKEPKEKHSTASNDYSSVLTEENNFLLLCVGVLEKRNAVLTESLTNVKDILKRSCRRSRSLKQCECTETRDGQVHAENPCKKKQSFSDIIKHETRIFFKSNTAIKTTSTENSNCISDVFKGSDKVKKYLETLSANKEISNEESIKLQSPKMDKNNQKKDRLKISTSDNAVRQKFMHSSTEPNVSLKPKVFLEQTPTPTRKTISQTGKSPSESNQNKFPFLDLKDPTKELKEFIDKMAPREMKKFPSSGIQSSAKLLNGFEQKLNTFERDTSMIGDGSAHSTSNIQQEYQNGKLNV